MASHEEVQHPEHIAKFGHTNMSFIDASSTGGGKTFSRTPTQSSLGSIVGLNCSDDHKVVCWSDIFQPPVVRQYIQNGRLYREREERTPDRFELFLDLVLVGVVHQLADVALEGGSNGATTAKIILCFYCCWSIWSDTRTWSNQSGVDDVTQRIQVLAILICLCGFSVNAAAIDVGTVAAHGGEEAASAAHRFLRRAAEAVAGSAESEGVAEETHGPQHAVVAATAFFLVAKFIRIGTYIGYMYWMPDFRTGHFSRVVGLIAVSLVFVGCLIAEDIKTVAILAGVGALLEILLKFTVGIAVGIERHRFIKRQRENAGQVEEQTSELLLNMKAVKLPAFNIEHMVERTAAFVTVVLGESVVSLLFTASRGSFGLSDEFARAVFGLTIAFIFNAVFYDSALSKKFVHAIRRHWITHILWDVAHYPLCTGLILSSAALHQMVASTTSPRAVHWQYGGGLGVSLACIAIIGLLHESLDPAGSTRLSQLARALLRFAVALFFVLSPLANWKTNLSYLGTDLGVFSALVVFEIWIKLGREEIDPVDHRIIDADGQDDLANKVAQGNFSNNNQTGSGGRKLRFVAKNDEDEIEEDESAASEESRAVAASVGLPVMPVVSRTLSQKQQTEDGDSLRRRQSNNGE
ncbi:hypothetical protein OIO90_000349 [Microbotryomycetes sp. JL221]|nr:hypothetical protein OIO90_000349 [Microbotryomycetes sp. JL221]